MIGRYVLRALIGLGVLALGLLPARAAPAPIPSSAAAGAVAYDIVYVRQPRYGDNAHITWPEVFHPGRLEPGSDLVLLHPNGVEEVLVDTTHGAVTDPFISFDGQSVYYSYFPDVTPAGMNPQRGLPYAGADIYRLHLTTRQITRLTFQEFEPNTGAGTWYASNPLNPPNNSYNSLGYGILNLGPAPLAGGKIIFVSNRFGFVPPKGYTNPTLQLFVMDADGSNVTPIGPMTIGSALHPTPLADGRVMFSTFETQGLRDSRNWGLWAIWPDGRQWEPIVSSFKQAGSFHFATQLSDGDLVVEDYYNLNNWGFGTLYRLPSAPPPGQPGFYPADVDDNPAIAQIVGNGNNPGFSYPFRMSFTPKGLYSITPFTNGNDDASPIPLGGGARVGKFTHPSGAPGNDLLVVWTPGPANALNRPTDLPAVDAGLYLLPGGGPISAPSDLILIKNDPNYNEVWPRAVAPYSAIHGVAQPAELPWLPNDGAAHPAQLPAGTPYGLIGTSSFYNRESAPGFDGWGNGFDGLDPFNTSQNDANSNWTWQGADAGLYTDADIWAVRIVALEANTHRSYGPNSGQHFFNHVNEKLRILGEIPLRKFDGQGQAILDPQGNPDTSFLARIPADTPFTFQMLDRNGMLLTMAQTWHQVRPGEARYDCGGCHAHSQPPVPFEQTAAGQPDYVVWDLTTATPLLTHDADGDPDLRYEPAGAVNVEFYQDIRPLLQAYCTACHTGATPPGNLTLTDTALYDIGDFTYQNAPGDYMRLCRDEGARWGYAPLVSVGTPVWRQTNASRYVRLFQSRRSLLLWQVFGERLDGWTNGDHPTETTPGNPTTLPGGPSQINLADLDFTATASHPASGLAGMNIDEKLTFARWVDLGCPINTGQGANANFGWFVDDQRPTLAVSVPRPGLNPVAPALIRVGIADAYTGIAPGSLSITATIPLAGRLAGAQLADLAVAQGGGIYTIALGGPLPDVAQARLYARVADNQGNLTRVVVTFSVLSHRLYVPLVAR
jgi:hypothetical protein